MNPEARWAYKLRSNYGISVAQYMAMLAEQGGGCAICGTQSNGARSTFAVDHDHACCAGKKSCGGCVRGLLCTRCNTALGMVNDQPDLLRRAIAYLSIGKTTSSISAL